MDYEERYDCVGISFFTPQAESAYAVGDRFRERGVPVLMGGMHPSIIPSDAAPHCASICLGEVEALWPEILADLRAGALKPRYGPRTPTASEWVRPVRALRGPGGGYDWKPTLLQVARGCPRPCLYCNLPHPAGRRAALAADRRRGGGGARPARPGHLRDRGRDHVPRPLHRAVHDRALPAPERSRRARLLDELPRLQHAAGVPRRAGRGAHALQLRDPRLRSHLARHLPGRAAPHRQERGGRWTRCRSEASAFHAAFGVGFDEDDPGVFDRIPAFCREAGVMTAEFFIATPSPNTPLWHQLSREERIHHRRWGR
ncbi:MAG: cobalamin-dependent protein [Sandaracinaceae bacterium]|nr:cobalamin-dependent protein [Sandaracinaceae bacterium]